MHEGMLAEQGLSVHLAFLIDLDRERVVLSTGAVQPLAATDLLRTIERARVESRPGHAPAKRRAG